MFVKRYKPLIVIVVVIIAVLGFIIYQNQSATHFSTQNSNQHSVTIAYQTGVDPSKVAQAHGDYEENSQYAIAWKKFDAGSDVINALASGDVDIGNLGSSPFAAAASKNLPIEVFLIAAKIGSSEALVVRNAAHINKAQDLIGKTIAVPFVSTTHYSLLSALKHWGIDDKQVKIINLRPPEISAAWQRGDIDAAYVWEPALSKTKAADGTVLTDSQQVAQWGSPTYDLWAVRKDFAEKNPEFVASFVKTTLAEQQRYRENRLAYSQDQSNISAIARLTGSSEKEITLLLDGNLYLDAAQQKQVLSSELAKNIFDTATFLKSQGKVDQVKSSYQENVSTAYLP